MPPNVGARTPCPNTLPEGEGACRLQHQARSPPQHLHAAHIAPYKSQARVPALVALPKGTLVEQGRHPPGPCSRDLVSAKWFPAHLAEGSRGGMGPSTSVLAQGHAGGAGGATHRTLAQGARCQLNGFPCALLKGRTRAGGAEPARPCPRGRAGAFSLCPVSRPALSSLCCFCCGAVLSGLADSGQN